MGAFGAGTAAAGGAGETAGLVAMGGAAGGASTIAGPCCLLMMAFRASPGLEIWERSILVLISSPSGRLEREDRLELCAVLATRRRIRTFSASWSSRELEWLFFSVTPTSGSTSRIDLLFTSSSLARSLIRILLIRPFALRTVPLSLHINLTASVFRFAHPLASARKYRTYCFSSEGAGSSVDSALSSCPLFSSTAGSAGGAAATVSVPASGAASTSAVTSSELAAASSAAGYSVASPSAATAPDSPPSRLEK